MPIPATLVAHIQLRQPNFTHLDLSNCGLNDNDMTLLQEYISSNPYITSLDLSRNNITTDGVKMIALLNSIKDLNLKDNYIDDETLPCLLNSTCLSNLERLNVSDNNLTDDSVPLLIKEIQDPACKLKYVDIDGNRKISEANKILISKSIKTPDTLQHTTEEKTTQSRGILSKFSNLLGR